MRKENKTNKTDESETTEPIRKIDQRMKEIQEIFRSHGIPSVDKTAESEGQVSIFFSMHSKPARPEAKVEKERT